MPDLRPITRRQAFAAGGTLLAATLAGCSGIPGSVPEEERGTVSDRPAPDVEEEPAAPEDPLEAEVSAAMEKLTLEQKIWQLFVVRPEAVTGVEVQTAAGEATRAALAERPVAGICYFAANLLDADQTRSMLSNTMAYGREDRRRGEPAGHPAADRRGRGGRHGLARGRQPRLWRGQCGQHV